MYQDIPSRKRTEGSPWAWKNPWLQQECGRIFWVTSRAELFQKLQMQRLWVFWTLGMQRGEEVGQAASPGWCVAVQFWISRSETKNLLCYKPYPPHPLILRLKIQRPHFNKDFSKGFPKGNQPWIFTGRTDAEAPMLWPPDGKSHFIDKDPNARKDWGKEEKRVTKDEMVRWYHWLNGHEYEQTLGDGKGQGSLACCSPWSHKALNTNEQLNNKKDFLRATS